jgi:hypothetical protein
LACSSGKRYERRSLASAWSFQEIHVGSVPSSSLGSSKGFSKRGASRTEPSNWDSTDGQRLTGCSVPWRYTGSVAASGGTLVARSFRNWAMRSCAAANCSSSEAVGPVSAGSAICRQDYRVERMGRLPEMRSEIVVPECVAILWRLVGCVGRP